MGNKILFETPIEISDGKIVHFIQNNRGITCNTLDDYEEELEMFYPEISNFNQNCFTLVQFPSGTESITFLK
jgi:hypothetical protein